MRENHHQRVPQIHRDMFLLLLDDIGAEETEMYTGKSYLLMIDDRFSLKIIDCYFNISYYNHIKLTTGVCGKGCLQDKIK